MRTWVKATLTGAILIALAVLALAGLSAYFVLGNMNRRTAGEAEMLREMDAIRTRFGPRPPLVEIVDPRMADIRIHRLADGDPQPVSTIHVINWKSEDGLLMRTEAPLWLMRFSSVNLLSRLGIGPARLRLTVSDIERYGPGVIVDYTSPGQFRVIVWVD